MIDSLTIDKIKESSNIVDVIRDFYDLRDAGNGAKTCLCPFHADRHIGSFKVSERKNVYTCFSCGAHGGPVDFLMSHEKLSFTEAIQYLGKKYGIHVEGEDKFTPKPCKPHQPVPPLPTLILPKEMVRAKLCNSGNALVDWLKSIPWADSQRERIDKVLKAYCIGKAKNGAVIFWQIDDEGNVRTGKMMHYLNNGHRDKTNTPGYVHSELIKAKWYDPEQYERRTCYFGQHLIDLCPGATINIVESEKTALICSIAYGNMKKQLWVATGGLQFLNKQNLEPFVKRKRKIVLYPDKDGTEQWYEKAKDINYQHLTVNREFMRKFWEPKDGEKADIADIIIRIQMERPHALDIMKQDNPAVGDLINTFDLIEQTNGTTRRV